jgi:hypothetical protein
MNTSIRTGKLRILLGLLVAASNFHSVFASTVLSMDIDQLASEAELIFEGEVLQHSSQLDPSSGIINTYVTFAIFDVVKGDYNGQQLELKFAGGTINGETVEISGLILPRVAEQGIYFVESLDRSLINPLLGWSQGHYLIIEENGERLVNTVSESPVTDVRPVANIPRTLRRPQMIVDSDAAFGVVTDSSALGNERALSAEEFKDRIQQLIRQ